MSDFEKKKTVKEFTSSLKLISSNYAYRCDAKFADAEVLKTLEDIKKNGAFQLGDYLPQPFVKGIQPIYLDQPSDDTVPVVSTLAIQNLALNLKDCRHISRDDFDGISDIRKLKKNDVLLTVDGGVSIGKPCLFSEESDYTVDSHVVILRPDIISPLALVYLLASPLGQIQFRRAESGASGQTTVTEDDIRRFIFPIYLLDKISVIAKNLEAKRLEIAKKRAKLFEEEMDLWSSFG